MNVVIVTQPHIATYQMTIEAISGQSVIVGPEDVDFPGWVWCTDENGISGWVPKSYLAIENDSGRLIRDYDARELTVATGDRLTVLEQESSWLYCETDSGLRGWIPVENVRIV